MNTYTSKDFARFVAALVIMLSFMTAVPLAYAERGSSNDDVRERVSDDSFTPGDDDGTSDRGSGDESAITEASSEAVSEQNQVESDSSRESEAVVAQDESGSEGEEEGGDEGSYLMRFFKNLFVMAFGWMS